MTTKFRGKICDVRLLVAVLIATIVAACGGGGGDNSSPMYSVGGSVSGLLSGTSVVLQDNGSNNTPVAVDASFSFSMMLASGSPYAVTVLTQPTGEKCSVANGSGVVASANVAVAVSCTPNPYKIGGSVTGLLKGNNVVLLDNGGNTTTVSANGSFTFSTSLLSGSAYAVTVATEPTGQNCTVGSGSGTLAGANVTDVVITCSVKSYTLSADVFGLVPNASIVLQDNDGDNLTISNSGTVAFATQLPSASTYSVTVLTQPPGETCFVTNGTGTVAAANVTVSVICPWHVAYVANETAGTISAWYIDPVLGSLQAVPGSPFQAGQYPTALAVTPNGKFAMVTNQFDPGSVSVFAIAPATGSLTQVAGSPFAAGANPLSISIDPTGQFVYVGELGDENSAAGGTTPDGIFAYSINNTTGSLTQLAGSPFTGSPEPVPLILDPSGAFLFTWGDSDTPAIFTVNSSSGVLTPIAGSTGFASSDGAVGGVAITPNGSFLYSSADTAPGVNGYAINASTGALTPMTGSPFGDASEAYIAVAPGGQFAYVADPVANVVLAYAVNQSTGALSAIVGGTYSLPAGPYPNANVSAIALDPSGEFLLVSAGGQIGNGFTQVFAVNSATGSLTPVSGAPFTQGTGEQGGFSIAITALP
jgi:6-phosphogluconolactonase (cycloisomerase 2 family)